MTNTPHTLQDRERAYLCTSLMANTPRYLSKGESEIYLDLTYFKHLPIPIKRENAALEPK
jgi:hypothetical protein